MFHVKLIVQLHMKQIDKSGAKNKVGAIGEQIAANYLKRKGLSIIECNYLKKWGEIDIVTRETGKDSYKIRFIEVKTVSYETVEDLSSAVSKRTWRPEENVHSSKLRRLHRTIDSWIMENNYEGAWEIDIVAIRVVPREKYATVKHIDNVIMS